MQTPYRWLAAVAGCFLAAPSGLAQPSMVSTIRDNGPVEDRIDIAILGDGYTRAERQKYQTDVARLVDELFKETPFREYESYFNVHRVHVESNESGADDTERTRDTALHARYNCDNVSRMLCASEQAVRGTLWDANLAPAARDIVVVLVNDSRYGGSATAFMAVTSLNEWGAAVLLHEIGHRLGLLADEYYPGPRCNAEVEPAEANVTRYNPVPSNKWSHWIRDGASVPTSGGGSDVVGAYEGAKYCETGLYRPTPRSRMKSVNEPFGQVNTEELILRIYNLVSLIESTDPAPGELEPTQCEVLSFSVQTPGRRGEPDTLTTTWRIDDEDVATGNSLMVDTCDLADGQYRIEVTVLDATAAVQREVLAESRHWNISVSH